MIVKGKKNEKPEIKTLPFFFVKIGKVLKLKIVLRCPEIIKTTGPLFTYLETKTEFHVSSSPCEKQFLLVFYRNSFHSSPISLKHLNMSESRGQECKTNNHADKVHASFQVGFFAYFMDDYCHFIQKNRRLKRKEIKSYDTKDERNTYELRQAMLEWEKALG